MQNHKKEIIATLLKAKRPDLANAVARLTVKGGSEVTAASPAADAWKHELQPYFSREMYKALDKVDKAMLEILDNQKWPEPRMEYGVNRHRSNNQTQEQFIDDVIDEYTKWSGQLKKALRS